MSYTTGTGTAGDAPGGAAGGSLAGTYPNPTIAQAAKGMPQALTGAVAATRYVGGTASGAPVTGTFAVGDFVIDQTGKVYVCTVAGTPGTWVQSGSTSYLLQPARVAATGTIDPTVGGIPSSTLTDGVTVANGDRVILQDFNAGIWVVNSAGAWSRATDASAATLKQGMGCFTGYDGNYYFNALFYFFNQSNNVGVYFMCPNIFNVVHDGGATDGAVQIEGNLDFTNNRRTLREARAFQTLTTPPISTTVYQNTNPFDLQASLKVTLAVNPVLASDCKVEISPDNFGSAQTWADPGYAAGAVAVGSDPEYVTFPIPAGWYYKVTSTNATIGALVAIG